MKENIQFLPLISLQPNFGVQVRTEDNSKRTVIIINPTANETTYPTSCTILILKMGISRQVFVLTINGHINMQTFDYVAIYNLMNDTLKLSCKVTTTSISQL